MGFAHFIGQVTVLAASAVLLLTVSLGGCASSAGSSLMDARDEASAPPKPGGYPSVEALPPNRESMPADEQSKLKKELLAAHDRQAASPKAQGGSAHAKPTKPPAGQPTNQAIQQ
ncbi:hypothetical protein [Bradyrhizobium sp.]|uniref:hypothetical protein n=1 Tax=Bradyrhizobium sp. TaxID=376 RepID=UPI002CB47258|nr:hypothetical protein [Bradyrhizobium sp.]HWX58524.1 hypothetical protein [Bradyrhizobium sp.]